MRCAARKAYEILNCVPGVHMALPESGFLGWIDVSELGNSTEIAQYLVTHARVSLNDGVNYGPGGARTPAHRAGRLQGRPEGDRCTGAHSGCAFGLPPQINSRFPLFNFPCVVLK